MAVGAQQSEQGQLPVVDFLDPGFRADPYARFAELHAGATSLAVDSLGATHIAFRYDDVARLLRDPRISVTDYASLTAGADSPLVQFLSSQLLAYKPAEHARVRRLVSKAFTPRRVESLRGHIGQLVDGLLDRAAEAGSFDAIADLGFPMPVIVICELLGVDPSDRHRFQGWSADLAAALDPIFDPNTQKRADDAVVSLRDYLGELIEAERRSPGDGLLADLVVAEEQGDRLSHEELICNTLLLLFAGHETTKNLIGNGLLALLQHPAELARLRDQPELLPGAIEEMLRFDPPVGLVGRTAVDDVPVGDAHIPKGGSVALSLMAANRDPNRFPNPEQFDVSRTDVRHLSFGMGAHYCIGAPLARLEAYEAFTRLLGRFPSIELATESIDRKESFVLRGVESLLVAVRGL